MVNASLIWAVELAKFLHLDLCVALCMMTFFLMSFFPPSCRVSVTHVVVSVEAFCFRFWQLFMV